MSIAVYMGVYWNVWADKYHLQFKKELCMANITK